MPENTAVRKGAKTKILGVIVLFLAALNSMLSWRGGSQPNEFYFLLLLAGGFLFALGTVRAMPRRAKHAIPMRPTGESQSNKQ
ncbi:MAG: hypothetical protein QF609_12085 [Gammaproteobacteria bacterium]|jgi:hypothetical protein|nr:hypothetical protein [Gammaproteobacteria bacterium]